MKKNPFRDLQATDGMLRVIYAIELIAIVIEVVACVAWGIVWCVNYSVLYGCLVLFGGVIAAILSYFIVWCRNAVMRCFYDAACASREMYSKDHPDVMSKVETPSEYKEISFVVYNETKKIYASDLKDQVLLFSDDEDDAMLFDDDAEAKRLMNGYDLSEKDGWTIKQVEL